MEISIKLLLTLILLTGISQTSFSKNKEVNRIDPQLFNFDILQQLIKSSSLPLDKFEGCTFAYQDSKLAAIQQPTLGHFISWNLSIFSQNKNNSSELKCDKMTNINSCILKFKSNSGKRDNSPWNCGLKFNIDNSNIIDTHSISCIGTC